MSASNARGITLLLAAAAVSMAGCGTTGVLRRQSVNYAKTPMDIHQQQVLDNLAKFVYDPHSMPSFSIAQDGQADVTDKVSGGLSSMKFDVAGFTEAVVGLDGERQSRQYLTMVAVNDPRRLELMRCAFQKAVANCHGGQLQSDCPDCERVFNRFYTGSAVEKGGWNFGSGDPCASDAVEVPCPTCDPASEQDALPQPQTREGRRADQKVTLTAMAVASEEPAAVPVFVGGPSDDESDAAELVPVDRVKEELQRCKRRRNLVPDPASPEADGSITSECLSPGCCVWFGHGPKECVPRDCDCMYVGSYCGTYVWVRPGRGRDELAKLTLAILDYALSAPAAEPVKEVVLYRRVDSRGNEWAATSSTATKKVTIVVPASDLGEGALAYPDDRSVLAAEPDTQNADERASANPAEVGSVPTPRGLREGAALKRGVSPIPRGVLQPARRDSLLTPLRSEIERATGR